MKTLLRIIAALAFTYFLLMLTSCGGDEPAARIASSEITYTVTASTGGVCVEPELVVIAVVDKDDKFEDANKFDCDYFSGSADLDAGDILEIRIYSESSFDKLREYQVTITQNGETESFAIDYKGASYLVK